MAPKYRQFEHTSDLKVEIYGKNLPELFSNAAFCLFDIMLDHTRLGTDRTEEVRLASSNLSELFLDWLRELLFLFSTRSLAVARTEIAELTETGTLQLTARIHGTTYDPAKHGLKHEVKTPTYHEYRIELTPAGYRATVVFDV